MGNTYYECLTTSTCPRNTIYYRYSCCSTSYCNTGTATDTGISCNVGTNGGTITQTLGCTQCQVILGEKAILKFLHF